MMMKVLLFASLLAGFLDVSCARTVRSKARAADDKDVMDVSPTKIEITTDEKLNVRLIADTFDQTVSGFKNVKMEKDWTSIVTNDKEAVSMTTFTAKNLKTDFLSNTTIDSLVVEEKELNIIGLANATIAAVAKATKKGSECEIEVNVLVVFKNPIFKGEGRNALAILGELIENIALGLAQKFNEILSPLLEPVFAENIKKMIENNKDWKNKICSFKQNRV